MGNSLDIKCDRCLLFPEIKFKKPQKQKVLKHYDNKNLKRCRNKSLRCLYLSERRAVRSFCARLSIFKLKLTSF